MAFRHLVKNIPYLGGLALDHLLRAAHCVHVSQVFQSANDEWLEKNQRHLLRQPTLIQLELGTNDNYRTA